MIEEDIPRSDLIKLLEKYSGKHEFIKSHLENFPIYIETASNRRIYGYESVNHWIRQAWIILSPQSSTPKVKREEGK